MPDEYGNQIRALVFVKLIRHAEAEPGVPDGLLGLTGAKVVLGGVGRASGHFTYRAQRTEICRVVHCSSDSQQRRKL